MVTLLIHPQGAEALDADLVRALAQEGQAVYAIDPFGTGKNTGEQDPEAPRGSGNFFTTFNRTDAAERVYDTVLAVRHLLATQTGPIHVVGLQEAGLWALLAAAASGPQERSLRFVVDVNGFDTAAVAAYLSELPIPGILRAGGLANAAALVAPHDLLLHNAQGHFASEWAERAYALYPDAALVIEKARIKNEQLAAYLTRE